MRWSVRNTMLAIVLPLAIVTLSLSAAQVADLLAVRHDISLFRDSAFRSIYAERYARSVQALLNATLDQLAARREGLDAIASAHARTSDALLRLREFVHPSNDGDERRASELTMRTLAEWEEAQEQVENYIERAVELAQQGEVARARRLLADDVDLLVRSRILSSVDLVTRREQEIFEEYRVRVMRATEHWLGRYTGAVDLQRRVLPDFYEAILAERFARHAHAEFKSFSHHVLEGRSIDASHGLAASQFIAQLGELQRTRLEHGNAEDDAVLGLAESYALVREAYARTLALPAASLRSKGASVVRGLGEVFDQSLLPHTNAIVWAREQSIRREISRLDRWAQGIFALTIGAAAFALLLSLGTPYVTHRVVVKPVVDLVDAVSNFRAGDRDARPRLRPRSELGQLASSLNGLLDELEQSHEKVRALALFDGTTGLPNRQYFQERLAGALVKARLHKRTMGLLAVNMAGLKQVNETLGIAAGDDLIRQASKRLRECVRLTDVVSRPTQDEFKTEVSHLGGDEFTILLSKVSQATDPAFVAQRVLSLLAEPFRVEDRDIALSLSIGIGVYPQDGTDADTLLRNASAAMNQAREGGGSSYQFYSEAMNVANSRKLHIQGRLSGALERGDLALHFQPIRDAQHGHLTGAEALLRWTDSEMGPVGPDEFMAIAEYAGLVSQIGSWVLHSACDQLRVWREAGYPPIRMSVNVSATQLQDDDWVETVADALRSSGANPECLELEITETSILQEGPSTLATLTSISEMGVGIVLDDFGTGYSSLSNLRSLPIGRVKVDRSFVSEIAEDGQGGAIAAAVIALALSLDLEVVAEGVETHDQANFLRSKGCTELQGYLISRPLAASEFERFMDRHKQESEQSPLEV